MWLFDIEEHARLLTHPLNDFQAPSVFFDGLRPTFLSYIRDDFKFYAGWRERGNFGLKLAF